MTTLRPRLLALACMTVLVVASMGSAQAATFTIVNLDGANEGFNDPAARTPIGGNSGGTLGAQRMIACQYALNLWGAILPSTVDIRIQMAFNPLTCDATSGVLGSTSTLTTHANFGGAEFANTTYHSSLANKQAGVDLAIGANDINTQMNSSIDNAACLGATSWYYGLDLAHGVDINIVSVVMHEAAHGLGFSTFTNNATGVQFNGITDIFARFLFDETVGLHWNEMTNPQRQASAINTGELTWDGFATSFVAPKKLRLPLLTVNSPPVVGGDYGVVLAQFGPRPSDPGITGDLVLVDDGVAPNGDGCEPLVNGAAIAGNIAVFDRGLCTFVSKAVAAQAAGAIAVVIVNHGVMPGGMAGFDPSLTIPTVMVTEPEGELIKSEMLNGPVNATVGLHPTEHPGLHANGRVQMYAPNPLAPGSSVSHFDLAATFDLLMEPGISGFVLHDGDLARTLFEDIGWMPRTTDVPKPVARADVRLRPNVPNPFAGSTTIEFAAERPGVIGLRVFDMAGRHVKHLMHGHVESGLHAARWDGTDDSGRRAPAGVYLYRLELGGQSEARRMVLLD